MLITDVLSVPVRSGFFADDQAAIALGAPHDGATYVGAPVTPGFRSTRSTQVRGTGGMPEESRMNSSRPEHGSSPPLAT